MLEMRNESMLSKNVAGFATRKSGPIRFAAIEANDMRPMFNRGGPVV